MAFYTALTPPADPALPLADQLGRTVFLKDGFSLHAFVFTGLWLLSKKLWLAFVVFAVIWAAIGFAGRMLGFDPLALTVVQLLIGLYLGLEGNVLTERRLLAKGWTLAGVVEGRDIDTVERRFFESVPGLGAPAAPGAPAPAAPLQPLPAQGVLGLFPDPARR
ncbi:MAG: DUF2628 domain-containing protein [Hyphomicrobiales bacterium]|nr:DUF2628 domain-containing protein [Hyphomicrobiales bacterium]